MKKNRIVKNMKTINVQVLNMSQKTQIKGGDKDFVIEDDITGV